MRFKFFRVITALLLVLWMTLIFTLSDQTAAQSSETSGGLTYKVFSVLYPGFDSLTEQQQNDIIEQASFVVRKTAHFCIYSVLGVLAFFAVASYDRISFKKRIAAAMAIGSMYAATDELHQKFVAGRSCELRDWVIDTCGVILAVLLCYFLARRWKRLEKFLNIRFGE